MAVKPFVKWVGGKARQVKLLDSRAPEKFKNYYEPFAGSGAYFFYLAANGRILPGNGARLNDVNHHLVNAYLAVKRTPTQVVKKLNVLEARHEEDPRETYYSSRDEFNKTELSDLDRAALFIYLNKTGYNGLYRVNAAGDLNVPMGSYKNPTICVEADILETSLILNQFLVSIGTKDFASALSSVEPRDFVYLDPPYDPLPGEPSFTGYTKDGFGLDDQIRLADTFTRLDELGAFLMMSNRDTPTIRELYSRFDIEVVSVNRSISRNGSDRRVPAQDVIVTNRRTEKWFSMYGE